MTTFERVEFPADRLEAESVVAFYFSDKKLLEGPAALLDWRLDGQLTRMLLSGDVLGKAGEHVMLQNNGKLKSDWVLFVGGGQWAGLSEETHASLIRHMLNVASQAGFTKISLAFMPHEDVSDDSLHQQIIDAMAVEGHNISECRYSCLATVTV
ncbi:M17 family peptidase N-terminal domain-containing protein [Deltaproteobacteria bacterium IMCC39524]|nr:M17 family peptidase N-terminal domain-containing protein [Deltaproteobacteria bacterium IMCC39524]